MNIQLDVYHKYQTKRGAEIVDDKYDGEGDKGMKYRIDNIGQDLN